jgi:RNA polymerase sigma factor (TIGR02999 family)
LSAPFRFERFASVGICERSDPQLQWVAKFSEEFVANEPMPSADVTRLLKAWRAGDDEALVELIPYLYEELRRLARRYMRNERRGGITLQATALVNEVYLRLLDAQQINWKDRSHFLAISAQLMRRVLVEAARGRKAVKRGGQHPREVRLDAVDLDRVASVSASRDSEIVALDDALSALGKMDARKVQVIELRFFSGLSVEETANVLNLSPQTVLRDWKLAKVWLTGELKRSGKAQRSPFEAESERS